jgi:hypothetical protein
VGHFSSATAGTHPYAHLSSQNSILSAASRDDFAPLTFLPDVDGAGSPRHRSTNTRNRCLSTTRLSTGLAKASSVPRLSSHLESPPPQGIPKSKSTIDLRNNPLSLLFGGSSFGDGSTSSLEHTMGLGNDEECPRGTWAEYLWSGVDTALKLMSTASYVLVAENQATMPMALQSEEDAADDEPVGGLMIGLPSNFSSGGGLLEDAFD